MATPYAPYAAPLPIVARPAPTEPRTARDVPAGRCAHVLRDNEPAVRVRAFCMAPARWLCVLTRAWYCDEHAHDDEPDTYACCQLAERVTS